MLVYATIHMKRCLIREHHSPQIIAIVFICIQLQIFKFNSCVLVCILDFMQNLNSVFFQMALLSGNHMSHCTFSCTRTIVVSAVVAVLTTDSVSRIRNKYAQEDVRVHV